MRREQSKTFFTQNNILMWTAVFAVVFGICFIGYAYWDRKDSDARATTRMQWSSLNREVEQAESELKNEPDYLVDSKKESLKYLKQQREQVEKRSHDRWGKHPRDL